MTTLIGTNPDQIPVNSMLGGMAYQDPDSINVKDFNSSGTANIASLVSPAASITNLSYSGTLTGGTGVINIGSNQIYKDASGNIGLGAVPISNGKTLALVNTTTNPSSFYLQNSTTGFTTADGTLLQLSGSAAYLWNFENSTLSLGTNNTEFVRLTSTGDLLNLGTGATKLQEGTTAQRPASPQEGMIRKNSTLGVIEGYSGGYVSLEAGRLIARTVFTSNGTFTPNSKTKELIVELVGGGGGSGGVPATGAGQVSVSGAGGFGGYYKAYLGRDNPIEASYTIIVGVGGAAGAAGANSGLAGSDSQIASAGANGAVAKGGHGGTAGAVETSFPVTRYCGLTFDSSYQYGDFQEWVERTPTRLSTIVHNSTGSATFADLKHPFASKDTVGVGGDFKVNFASTAQAAGNPGKNGEVIIYEYS